MSANYQKAAALTIHSANCLNRISPMAQCNICQDVCPQQSLLWQDEHWQAANCSLCGACAAVCPTQVFQIDHAQLLQQKDAEPILLCCSQDSNAPANAHKLNCLQQLSPLFLLYLLYQSKQSITIYLPLQQCRQCQQQWYAQGLQLQLQQYHIPAEKIQVLIQDAQTTEPTAPPLQRRDFLLDLLHRTEKQSKKAAAQTLDNITATFSESSVQKETPSIFPMRLPLYALYAKKQLPLQPEQPLPFHQLSCSRCTFCSACVHICPTQALLIEEIDQQKQLLYHPELCINCGLCQQICMQHGLFWDDWLTQRQFLQSPQQLAHSRQKICSQCQHTYYQWPADEQGSICSFCQS